MWPQNFLTTIMYKTSKVWEAQVKFIETAQVYFSYAFK